MDSTELKEEFKYLELTADQQKDVKFLLESASKDSARPVLECIFADNGNLIVADGFQMVVIPNEIGIPDGLWRFPRKMADIIKIFPEGGNFPDYKQIFPSSGSFATMLTPDDKTNIPDGIICFDPAKLTKIIKYADYRASITIKTLENSAAKTPIIIQGKLKYTETKFFAILMPMRSDNTEFFDPR